MNLLRIVLIVLSVGTIVAFTMMLKDSRSYHSDAVVFMILANIALAANVLYLLEVVPGEGGRIYRMFKMWLDAKEQDLKRRVTSRSVD